MAKPTKPLWAYDNPSESVIEPSTGLKQTGWLSGQKPPRQYMNWIHYQTKGWIDWLEAKTESNSPTMLRSAATLAWNGATITFAQPIKISFRVEGAEQVNQISNSASPIALSDGQVLVIYRDKTNSSPVSLSAGTYASLAAGQYAIVAESSLDSDSAQYETIIFRRAGSTLEVVPQGLIYQSGDTITLGESSNSFSVDLILAATKKYYLDGGGDTYLTESGANIFDAYAGGTNWLKYTFSTLLAQILGSDLSIPTTKKLYLDGGGDTYLTESSANVLDHVTGGTTWLRYTNSSTLAAILSADFAVPATKKIYLDGGGDTYWYESAANIAKLQVGGETALSANVSTRLVSVDQSTWDFSVNATRKVYLDGGSNTYLTESSADVIDIICGASLSQRIDNGGTLFPAQDPPTANRTTRSSGSKGWVKCDFGNATTAADYNVVSVTSAGVITWDTDFASANYAASALTNATGTVARDPTVGAQAAGTLTVTQGDGTSWSNGINQFIIAMGEQ